jgi:hypothetical protein
VDGCPDRVNATFSRLWCAWLFLSGLLSKKDFRVVIVVIDRLEQEMAQLLALRKKVADVERAARLFSVSVSERSAALPPDASTERRAEGHER